MKIAVYGTGVHGSRLLNFCNKNKDKGIEIVCFINTNPSLDSFCGYDLKAPEDVNYDKIDYVVIASQKYHDEMKRRVHDCIPEQSKCLTVDEYSFTSQVRPVKNEYRICTVESGLSYISSSKDEVISKMMEMSGMNWGSDILDLLLSMRTEGKLFFDIGANIGTTCIYAKKTRPDLKIIGFEPGKNNYDMLRINLILNDMEDIVINKCAVSDKSERLSYFYDETNPGGSMVSPSKSDDEGCYSISLDEYMRNNDYALNECGYLWIDVEGYEANVIIGAEEVIRKSHPYIVMEFNVEDYIEQGKLPSILRILEENYNYFVDLSHGCTLLNKIAVSKLSEYCKGIAKTDLLFTP